MLGAIISDVFWAKFRTIIVFSMAYCAGCAVLAVVDNPFGLAAGLGLIALGTGGIKPCVSTNVGDQFTSRNQHLIERAFSWFYISINAGSLISIPLCPWLLQEHGPRWAFGVPGIAMFCATLVFWMGRNRFAVVPPAMSHHVKRSLAGFLLAFALALVVSVFAFLELGALGGLGTLLLMLAIEIFLALKTPLRSIVPAGLINWLEPAFTGEGLKLVGRLLLIYVFVAVFWSLWDQSNGTTWTLQAQSALMNKTIIDLTGMGINFKLTLLPAQVQAVNALFILVLVPVFSYGIYPLWGRFFNVTPLRKIGIGFFVTAASFVVIAWIENRIQNGIEVSAWWQILAYGILTAGEVLVSITSLEFSYKQAPLRMKSFVMALYLLSVSTGNALTAYVADAMIKPIPGVSVIAGEQTTVRLPPELGFVSGQKIDFGGANGITVAAGKEQRALAGTYVIGEIVDGNATLLDVELRKPVVSSGSFDSAAAEVSTYKLVGPQFFLFFTWLMTGAGVVWIVVAMFYKEKTYVRTDADEGAPVAG